MCAYECCVYVCYMHTCVCIVFLMCVCEGTCALCVYACMHVLMFAFQVCALYMCECIVLMCVLASACVCICMHVCMQVPGGCALYVWLA